MLTSCRVETPDTDVVSSASTRHSWEAWMTMYIHKNYQRAVFFLRYNGEMPHKRPKRNVQDSFLPSFPPSLSKVETGNVGMRFLDNRSIAPAKNSENRILDASPVKFPQKLLPQCQEVMLLPERCNAHRQSKYRPKNRAQSICQKERTENQGNFCRKSW